MPDIATRGSNSELSYQQGDEQIAQSLTIIASGPVTLDAADNREIKVVTAAASILLPVAATLSGNLDSTHTASNKIGWVVTIINNVAGVVTIDANGQTLNGAVSNYTIERYETVTIGFDTTNNEYYLISTFHPNAAIKSDAETITKTWTFADLVVNKTVTFDEEFDAGTATATMAIDWTDGNKQKIALGTSNVTTISMTAPAGPTNLVLRIIQHASSPKTVTGWDASSPDKVNWQGGTEPIVTPTNSAVDIITLYFNGTDYYGAFGLDYK